MMTGGGKGAGQSTHLSDAKLVQLVAFNLVNSGIFVLLHFFVINNNKIMIMMKIREKMIKTMLMWMMKTANNRRVGGFYVCSM